MGKVVVKLRFRIHSMVFSATGFSLSFGGNGFQWYVRRARKICARKLSLLTTYSDISSDAADNIGKKKRKKVEQEVIISLNAPRAGNVVAFCVESQKATVYR